MEWNKLLEDDLYPHIEDDLRTGALEVMNGRPLQWEELWIGMPVYLYGPRIRRAFVLCTRKYVGIALEPSNPRDPWEPRWVKLSSLRHREEQA